MEADRSRAGAVVGAQGPVQDRHSGRRRAGLDVDRAVQERGVGRAVGRVAHHHRAAVDGGAVERDAAVGLSGVEPAAADDRAFDQSIIVGADVDVGARDDQFAQRTGVHDDTAARDREIGEFRSRTDADRAAVLPRHGGLGVEIDTVQTARDRRIRGVGVVVQRVERAARDREGHIGRDVAPVSLLFYL